MFYSRHPKAIPQRADGAKLVTPGRGPGELPGDCHATIKTLQATTIVTSDPRPGAKSSVAVGGDVMILARTDR